MSRVLYTDALHLENECGLFTPLLIAPCFINQGEMMKKGVNRSLDAVALCIHLLKNLVNFGRRSLFPVYAGTVSI